MFTDCFKQNEHRKEREITALLEFKNSTCPPSPFYIVVHPTSNLETIIPGLEINILGGSSITLICEDLQFSPALKLLLLE